MDTINCGYGFVIEFIVQVKKLLQVLMLAIKHFDLLRRSKLTLKFTDDDVICKFQVSFEIHCVGGRGVCSQPFFFELEL